MLEFALLRLRSAPLDFAYFLHYLPSALEVEKLHLKAALGLKPNRLAVVQKHRILSIIQKWNAIARHEKLVLPYAHYQRAFVARRHKLARICRTQRQKRERAFQPGARAQNRLVERQPRLQPFLDQMRYHFGIGLSNATMPPA